MSADNGLIIRKLGNGGYRVFEYDASGGSEYKLATFDTLENAVLYADAYCRAHIVEYGVSFDLASEGNHEPG